MAPQGCRTGPRLISAWSSCHRWLPLLAHHLFTQPCPKQEERKGGRQPASPHLPFSYLKGNTFPEVPSRVCPWPEMGHRTTPGPIPGPGRWACCSGLKSITLSFLGPGPWPAGEVSVSQLAGREGSRQASPQRQDSSTFQYLAKVPGGGGGGIELEVGLGVWVGFQ